MAINYNRSEPQVTTPLGHLRKEKKAKRPQYVAGMTLRDLGKLLIAAADIMSQPYIENGMYQAVPVSEGIFAAFDARSDAGLGTGVEHFLEVLKPAIKALKKIEHSTASKVQRTQEQAAVELTHAMTTASR